MPEEKHRVRFSERFAKDMSTECHAAEGGLFNQHLALLSSLTLGIASGCSEFLVEHSPRRKHSISSSEWEHEPFDSLWDADQLSKYLEGRICWDLNSPFGQFQIILQTAQLIASLSCRT